MKNLTLTGLIALSFAVTAPALAEETPGDLPSINAEDVSVGQVVSFVNAMIAAERVRQQYLVRIEEAETESEIAELVAEADQQGMAAVDRVPGITSAEYMAISLAARDSAELTERIRKRFTDMQEKQRPKVTQRPGTASQDAAE